MECERAKDGVHWNARAHRRLSNLILEEISKFYNVEVLRYLISDHIVENIHDQVVVANSDGNRKCKRGDTAAADPTENKKKNLKNRPKKRPKKKKNQKNLPNTTSPIPYPPPNATPFSPPNSTPYSSLYTLQYLPLYSSPYTSPYSDSSLNLYMTSLYTRF